MHHATEGPRPRPITTPALATRLRHTLRTAHRICCCDDDGGGGSGTESEGNQPQLKSDDLTCSHFVHTRQCARSCAHTHTRTHNIRCNFDVIPRSTLFMAAGKLVRAGADRSRHITTFCTGRRVVRVRVRACGRICGTHRERSKCAAFCWVYDKVHLLYVADILGRCGRCCCLPPLLLLTRTHYYEQHIYVRPRTHSSVCILTHRHTRVHIYILCIRNGK